MKRRISHGQAMPIYDGLYAWCRAEVAGEYETHTWTAPA